MSEILHQLRLVVDPIPYGVLYIPGAAGFYSINSINVAYSSSNGGD